MLFFSKLRIFELTQRLLLLSSFKQFSRSNSLWSVSESNGNHPISLRRLIDLLGLAGIGRLGSSKAKYPAVQNVSARENSMP